jgi:hypothetical protein
MRVPALLQRPVMERHLSLQCQLLNLLVIQMRSCSLNGGTLGLKEGWIDFPDAGADDREGQRKIERGLDQLAH